MGEQRVCVITGVLGALGAATASAFDDAGWAVVGWDVACSDRAVQERAHDVDITSSEAVNAAANAAIRAHGRVDALVNNAAVQVNASLLETDDPTWDHVLDTNLTGAFRCIRAFAPALSATGGAVVNVSSVHALATSQNAGVYAISKGALVSLTRVAALELGPLGVRCNAVLPGAIESKMLHEGLERRPHPQGAAGNLADLRARTPLGTIASPPSIARTILHLADTEASPFLTGATVVADGGATLRLATE